MRGSLKIFSWFQIPVYLHWSFGLILLLPVWAAFQEAFDLSGLFWRLFIIIGLFACVLLHEFGHSLMARRYGVNTQDIILTPIGGVARLERMPENPKQELMVAIAGPMVNVVIAAIILLISKYLVFNTDISWWIFKANVSEWLSLSSEPNSDASIALDSGVKISDIAMTLPHLLVINVMMVVFNLIPAFPMDGGRVLRALLAMQFGRVRATRAAALTGQIIAVLFVGIGLYFNVFSLALIGVFVFITARTENAMVQSEYILKKYTASDLVRHQYAQVMSNDWMQTPATMLNHGLERHFLVFDFSDQLVGYLNESQILTAIKKRDLSTEVRNYMVEPAYIVSEKESLQYVFQLIRNQNVGIVAIADEAHSIIGVIDATGLDNFLKTAR